MEARNDKIRQARAPVHRDSSALRLDTYCVYSLYCTLLFKASRHALIIVILAQLLH